MATIFESISLKGLRLTHLKQLMMYIDDREVRMWYTGPRTQFEQRHEDLKKWLGLAIEYAEDNDVRFPKGDIT